MKDKIIVFGTPTIDIKTMKEPDINITSFYMRDGMFHIVYEQNSSVKQVNLSTQILERYGVINLSNLNKLI